MTPVRPLGRKILTRLGVLVVSALVASIVIFVVCQALPGDVALVILGQNASPEAAAALRQRLGLDQPLSDQYFQWMGGLLTGDFGTSYLTSVPVADRIASRVPVTASLVGLGMTLSIVIAVPLGMASALGRRRASGVVLSGLSQIGLAVPSFWAGILLVWLFAIQLHWLPANNYIPFSSDPIQWARHLVLPVVSLALVQASILTRYVRSAIIEVLHEDHYRTARAIGWGEFGALARHGLRNASISVVTVLGLQLATVLVGAIVIESVFAMPGLGSLLLDAVAQRDLIIVQGTVFVMVLAVLVINTLVDLSYLVLDPRLRTEGDR